METTRSIKRLDSSVVRRIAAGEVVKRPANALKELIENSLDAGATTIQVEVKDGGMKYLQVVDNGSGINKDDLEILCERHTTSKLERVDDLCSINTYGFRGEALSSISLISNVSVTTKTAEQKCGYNVSYSEGQLKGKPLPCGANQGTVITVESMFYNEPLRRKALKNVFEEHKKIQDIVARYAVHNASVGFSLKKYGQNHMYINTLSHSSSVDVIGSIFGAEISRNLLEKEGSDETLQFKYRILASSLIYSAKQFVFLLFINHRLVKAEGLQKEIAELYSIYLPPKTYPFLYLSLEMAPANVDVNVHPRKDKVFYLYEEPINKKIITAVQQLILGKDAYKTYKQETLSFSQTELSLKNTSEVTISENEDPVVDGRKSTNEEHTNSAPSEMANMESECRTVNKQKEKSRGKKKQANSAENPQKQTAKPVAKLSIANSGTCQNSVSSSSGVDGSMLLNQDINMDMAVDEILDSFGETTTTTEAEARMSTPSAETNRAQIKPTSIRNPCEQEQSKVFPQSLGVLKKNIIDSCHWYLKGILKVSTFITCSDYGQMVIARENNVYECDLKDFCKEYFYQIVINDIGRLGMMTLSEPLPLSLLLQCAHSNQLCSKETALQRLMDNAIILNDYFSVETDANGNLLGVPWLLDGYFPSKQHLPEFIMQLACDVSWDKEHNYVDEVCLVIASYYSKFPSSENPFINLNDWSNLVESTLFPSLQKNFYPSTHLFLKSICEIEV